MQSMTRIQKLFTHHKAMIAYLTAGDGGLQKSLDAALALIEGGVNLLEIGLPFSDPIADGPVIQRASERAVASGTSTQDILQLVKAIRQHSDIPIILFSYLNPILASMKSNFLTDAVAVGIDGLLIVDCPIEESDALRQHCQALNIDLIHVITPSTPLKRIQFINRHAQGFLYYASRKGTTGVRDELPPGFQEKIAMIKSSVDVPVVVGFGISNKVMAENVLKHADGVVIGSLFVKALEEEIPFSQLTQLAKSIYPVSLKD